MSEAIDKQVLNLVVEFIGAERRDDVVLVNGIWKDRQLLIDVFKSIRDWDLAHSEALSVERVQLIVREVLDAVGEND